MRRVVRRLVYRDYGVSGPTRRQDQLCIHQSPDPEIYSSIPQDDDAGKRQAGAVVLFFRRIDESGSGLCDCRDRIQDGLSRVPALFGAVPK